LGAPRARTLRDRVGALWGFERATRLLEVERKDGPLAVSGLVAPPQLARGNRDEIVLIVNGRPGRDTQLTQTLIEAFRPPRQIQEVLYRAVQDALRQQQVVQAQRGLRTEGDKAVGATGDSRGLSA